jgi:hypothetical protein
LEKDILKMLVGSFCWVSIYSAEARTSWIESAVCSRKQVLSSVSNSVQSISVLENKEAAKSPLKRKLSPSQKVSEKSFLTTDKYR